MGDCYFDGNGVEKDQAEAIKWYTKAAERGYDKAQYSLGYCYYYGDGVERDLETAKKWYDKALAQNSNGVKITFM